MDVKEGTICVDGHRVWYRRVGRDGIRLLVLHGGPGAGHDYLEPLEGLARAQGRILRAAWLRPDSSAKHLRIDGR